MLGGGLVGQDVTAFVPIERLGQVCLPTLERMAAQLSGLDTQRLHVLHVAYPSGSTLWRALQTHPEEVLRVDLHDRLRGEIRARQSHPWPAPSVSATLLFPHLEHVRAVEAECLSRRNARPTADHDADWWRARVYREAIEDVWQRAVNYSRHCRARRRRQRSRSASPSSETTEVCLRLLSQGAQRGWFPSDGASRFIVRQRNFFTPGMALHHPRSPTPHGDSLGPEFWSVSDRFQ